MTLLARIQSARAERSRMAALPRSPMTYTQARKARPAFLAELALIDAEYGTTIPGLKKGRKTPEDHYILLGREPIADERRRAEYISAVRDLVDRYLAN